MTYLDMDHVIFALSLTFPVVYGAALLIFLLWDTSKATVEQPHKSQSGTL